MFMFKYSTIYLISPINTNVTIYFYLYFYSRHSISDVSLASESRLPSSRSMDVPRHFEHQGHLTQSSHDSSGSRSSGHPEEGMLFVCVGVENGSSLKHVNIFAFT